MSKQSRAALLRAITAWIVPNEPSLRRRSPEPHPVGFDCFSVGRKVPVERAGAGKESGW